MPRFATRNALPLVALALLLCGCGKASPDSAEANGSSLQPVTLNADEYRQEITAIDRLVFDPSPFDDARRASLASKLEECAQRVKSVSDSPFLQIEAGEMKTLAAAVKRMSEDGLRNSVPNQWMRIRNNLFDDRSWFARSAADL